MMICADDYGLTKGIGQAIRALISAHKINYVSCMVTGPHWELEGQMLRQLSNSLPYKLHVGLHLSFTTSISDPLKCHDKKSVTNFLSSSILRTVSRTQIAQEIEEQLLKFEEVFQKSPDFIDGHHHVHLYPGIFEETVAVILRKSSEKKIKLRNTFIPLKILRTPKFLDQKTIVISLLGLFRRKRLESLGLNLNSDFNGFFNYHPSKDIEVMLNDFIKTANPNSLFYCHPGFVDSELLEVDDYTYAREEEFNLLMKMQLCFGQ
jgi:predicted glycoside hydrolase/deacetylase ChbG (UPF0249 family)